MLLLRFLIFAAALVLPSSQLQLSIEKGEGDLFFRPSFFSHSELETDEHILHLRSQIYKDLQKFVASSKKDLISVVMAGDNRVLTTSGAMRFLLGENATIMGGPQIVSMRAEQALRSLEATSCTLKTGYDVYKWFARFEGEGGPHVAFYILNLHTRAAGDTGCFEDCFVDAIKILQPDAMFWTFGYHLEHMHPLNPCVNSANGRCFRNCGDYTQLVARSARMLMPVSPLLIWRTSYAICERKLPKRLYNTLRAWQDPHTKGKMEEAARQDCGLPPPHWAWADMLQDTHGAWLQTLRSKKVLADVSRNISILDSFKLTAGRCKDTEDGIHYPRIAMTEAGILASILGSGANGITAP